ncbi:phosphotransferase [Dactylosporangium sp. NPDC005555]|uniref:phosphotransferase enzyme family protein n=1 Tax=Dactylosporangium sp. NPDC005555 TaxID=3154889 RepID=UPI0033AAEBE6
MRGEAEARAAYGWSADAVLTPGPRGALGRIWRVDTVGGPFALKELFRDPPAAAAIDAELRFSASASAAGVRLPLSRPDMDGRYLHRTSGGTWLRLYDWIDLHPIDPSAPATPDALGTLLARLHRCAPPAPPDGEPWYDSVPSDWPPAAGKWAPLLAECLATLPALCADVGPADPATLLVCHRDLHPENILADPAGALVVVDWDDLGPAAPARELARMLFDWYCDDRLDLAAVRALYAAYVREGGPARLTGPADFTMLLGCRLNFLHAQLRTALDPAADPAHRAWSAHEIDEGLRLLPTRSQLAEVLTALRSSGRRRGMEERLRPAEQ